MNLSTLLLFTVMHTVVLIVYSKFEDCSSHRCWTDKMEQMLERKKNGQIKVLASHMCLLKYTMQPVIPDICTKFKNLGQVVLEKSLTKIFIFITLEGEIEKGTKIEKEGAKINLSTFVFFSSNTLGRPHRVKFF